jgi:DNA-binding NarL/FixJ family response regulator
LVRQASNALLAGAGRAGVIVGVDNAHLLDELSAMLVHQVALRRAATVVLTLRTGETPPDAVTALWKDGHLRRLELQPLSRDETTTLVEATLGGPVAAPLPLTNREREIITLAAGGLSNRQIADRLVVSVRTVEGHLYRACAKLGVSDRAELAARLRGD